MSLILPATGQIEVPGIYVDPRLMTPAEVERLQATDTMTPPPLPEDSSLAQIVEVAWDMFDVLWHDPRLNTQAKLDDLIHNLSESINRALYILMIGVAALSPYWKGIQDIIHILRRTGVTQKLLEPLDMLTPDRVFAVRMVLTSFMSEEIAVDALAYVYNQGHFFNIRYPSKLWGDWDPDSEDDEDSVEADDSKSDRTAR